MRKKAISHSNTENLNHDKLMKLIKLQFIFGGVFLILWWSFFQEIFWASIFLIFLAFIDLVKSRTGKVGIILIGCRFLVGIAFLIGWWMLYQNIFWISFIPFASGSMELKEYFKKK